MDHTHVALSTCCIRSESHKTILPSDLECTLTQSVTSASFFKILVQPEKSISNWPFGDSDIKALKNGIPNLYNNLPHRVSRNIFVLQQNDNMCSVGSNTVSWQRSQTRKHNTQHTDSFLDQGIIFWECPTDFPKNIFSVKFFNSNNRVCICRVHTLPVPFCISYQLHARPYDTFPGIF